MFYGLSIIVIFFFGFEIKIEYCLFFFYEFYVEYYGKKNDKLK